MAVIVPQRAAILNDYPDRIDLYFTIAVFSYTGISFPVHYNRVFNSCYFHCWQLAGTPTTWNYIRVYIVEARQAQLTTATMILNLAAPGLNNAIAPVYGTHFRIDAAVTSSTTPPQMRCQFLFYNRTI